MMEPSGRGTVTALAVTAAISVSAMVTDPAKAGLVATDQAIDERRADTERSRVADFLAREDVRRQMTEMGIDADEASDRVAGMSDAEVAEVAGKIDALPAGQATGSLVLVLLLVVLILLLI